MNGPANDLALQGVIASIVADHLGDEGPLIPILHAVQHAVGYVPDEALPVIAEALNLTRAEVYGVRTFYPDFRDRPPGRHSVKLCRGEACQSMGAVRLAETAMARLAVGWGETTTDGGVTLDAVYCLGLCSCAPAAQVDGVPHARLDDAKLGALLGGLSA